jgi:hypothetical protein
MLAGLLPYDSPDRIFSPVAELSGLKKESESAPGCDAGHIAV